MKFVNQTVQAVVIMACGVHSESVLQRLGESRAGNWFTVPTAGTMRSGYWSDVSAAHPCNGTAIFGFIESTSLSTLLESLDVTNPDGSLCADCAAYEWNVAPSHIAASMQDPVCGRVISAAEALTHEHEGELFFFCSAGCRDRFAADPAPYLSNRRPRRI